MRSKFFAVLTAGALIVAPGCGGDDQQGAAPGAMEQPGGMPAPTTGPGAQTPTTGPGMAPMAPGTGPGAAPGTPGMAGDTLAPGTTMPGTTGPTGAGTTGATRP